MGVKPPADGRNLELDSDLRERAMKIMKMNMNIMKWTSWLVVACLGLMSCEKKEVAETAAVVAVVSTVVALGMVLGDEDASAHDHDDDDNNDDDNYYYGDKKKRKKNTSPNDRYFSCRDGNICTSYIDYSGRGRESCGVVHVCQTGRHTHIHEGYDEHAHHGMPMMQHHHPRHYFMHQSTNTSTTLTDPVLVAKALEGRSVMELVSPHDFGQVHGMSTAAAQWLLEGIDKARHGDMSVLEEGGVSEHMLAQLTAAELPSVEQVDELARKLDQYPPVTIAMFSRLISVY